MEKIDQLTNRIRDLINIPRRQSNLLQDATKWNQLCSSLDVIGDTQMAIDEYPQLSNLEGMGASYLIVYGILQALFLQQDAVKNIGDALDLKIKLPQPLEKIRVIRNSAVGHPGYQKENKLSKSHFITRWSISPRGFELTTFYSGGKEYETSHISIPSLIETQQEYLGKILSKVISEMERKEREHREIYKDKKLIDIFPNTINRYFYKIYEAIQSKDRLHLGTPHLQTIADCIDSFQNELSLRGEWGVHESIDYHYELINYPLKRLVAYFKGQDAMNEKDAYIFASFLSNQIKLLREIANDMDEQYLSEP